MSQKPTHTHVFQIFIQTTPTRLWQALTDGTLTQQYYFGSHLICDLRVGGKYQYPNPAGGVFVEGEILALDPPRRLVQTFRPMWFPEDAPAPWSKVTWDIEPVGAACKLTLTHDNLEADTPLTHNLVAGWSQIISSLKTLLETGAPLDMAMATNAT